MSQSLIPQPRSSYRTNRKWPEKNAIQCRQTGLSRSYSRWVNHVAALTSGSPSPDVAQPRRTPSDA
jgi:hypothetical protein